jgi:hypothetical protein
MSLYKNFPDFAPTDGQTVWIRIFMETGTVFKATYSVAAQTFTSVTNSIVYPAYVVVRWKPL